MIRILSMHLTQLPDQITQTCGSTQLDWNQIQQPLNPKPVVFSFLLSQKLGSACNLGIFSPHRFSTTKLSFRWFQAFIDHSNVLVEALQPLVTTRHEARHLHRETPLSADLIWHMALGRGFSILSISGLPGVALQSNYCITTFGRVASFQ